MFYGWKITLLGSAGNFLLQGSTIYIMNAFIEPLNTLYGWNGHCPPCKTSQKLREASAGEWDPPDWRR